LWQQRINQSINHPIGQKTTINLKKSNNHPKRRLLRHLGSKTALKVKAEPAVVVAAAHQSINQLTIQ
jgi:hypothetical protein